MLIESDSKINLSIMQRILDENIKEASYKRFCPRLASVRMISNSDRNDIPYILFLNI